MSAPARGGGPRLVLVGCGRMGGALLRGWLEQGIAAPGDITVIEPGAGAREAAARMGVETAADPEGVSGAGHPDLVLFAVKPQAMDEVVPAYRDLVVPETAFLSIAAGRTAASFRRHLGEAAAVVRAMPNTPARVGRGFTALYATDTVTEAQRGLCETLMAAVGEVAWVPDEALMDAVTAVSGSGPAYLFHLIECLSAAARAEGLPDEMAERLARATVTGAAELAHQSGESPAALREQVTSPGGTTAAALEVLMAPDGFESLIKRAVAAAARRSRELAG